MNNRRRKMLKQGITHLTAYNANPADTEQLSQAASLIVGALDEEREAYDNLPSGLQETERGLDSADAISELCDAHELLDAIVAGKAIITDVFDDIVDQVETAIGGA